jgi:hypothetical protein
MRTLSLLSTLALMLCLSITAFAQQNGQDEGSQVERPSNSAQSQQPLQRMDLKTFTGKITKHNGSYVLYDMATNLVYELDNQELAKKYKSKEVSVLGQLTPPGNTIHVSKIVRAQ